MASAAVVWGGFAVAAILFPGSSGEWARLGVLLAAVIDIPVGGLTLAAALIITEGPRSLRRFCIVTSAVALSLPFIAEIIWKTHIHFLV
jgi:hypothetical protein